MGRCIENGDEILRFILLKNVEKLNMKYHKYKEMILVLQEIGKV